MSDVSYKWVIKLEHGGSVIVTSNWEGTVVERINPAEYEDIRADLEFGKPVVRRIGNGEVAMHYRFERVQKDDAA